MQAQVRSRASKCWIYCVQSGTGTEFSPSDSAFRCQYHSTNAPHSFIYHPRCIIFFSQYFSFPLPVPFYQCSILIHLSPTLYNVFLPVLQFSPVRINTPMLHTHASKTHAVESHQMTALSNKILLCISVTRLLRYTLSCLVFDSVCFQTFILIPAAQTVISCNNARCHQ